MAEEVVIKYVVDTNDLQKELKGVEDGFEKTEKTATKSQKAINKGTEQLSKGFQNLGLAIGAAFAVQRIVDFGKEMRNLAVTVETTARRMSVVFGDFAGSVDKAAKQMAASLGLSNDQFKLMATQVGDVLVPLGLSRQEAAKMSVEAVKLAGALAEFSAGQVTMEQAAHAMIGAFTGEREALKTLGVVINEAEVQGRLMAKGQKELQGQALATAKAMATFELITEKSADAQAFFASNSDSMARKVAVQQAKLQTLREEIAKKLTPLLLRLTEIVAGLLDSLDVDKLIQATSAVAGLGAAFKTWSITSKILPKPLAMIASALVGIGTRMGIIKATTIETNKALLDYQKHEKRLQEIRDEGAKSESDQIARLDVLIDKLKFGNLEYKEKQKWINILNKQYGTTLQNIKDEKKFVEQLDSAYEELIKNIQDKIKLEIAEEELKENIKEQIRLTAELNKWEQKLRKLQKEGGITNNLQLQKATVIVRGYKQDLKDVGEVIEGIKEKYKNINLAALFGGGGGGDDDPDPDPKDDEKATATSFSNRLQQAETFFKSMRNKAEEFALDTIDDDKALKAAMLQIELNYLDNIKTLRENNAIDTSDIEKQQAAIRRQIRKQDLMDVQELAKVIFGINLKLQEQMFGVDLSGNKKRKDLNKATTDEMIGQFANVAGAFSSLVAQTGEESKALIILEILLAKASAIAQIFSKGIKGDAITTAANIASLTAIVIGGFASVAAVLKQADAQSDKTQGLARFARGGISISGEGSGTGDKIPALLSAGESVITANMTRKYYDELSAIQSGTLDKLVKAKYVLPALKDSQSIVVDAGFTDRNLINNMKKDRQLEKQRHGELIAALNKKQVARKAWY